MALGGACSRRGDRHRGVVHGEGAARRIDGGADPGKDLPAARPPGSVARTRTSAAGPATRPWCSGDPSRTATAPARRAHPPAASPRPPWRTAPAADVEDAEDAGAVLAPRGAGHDPVDQRTGVAGPGPVVAVGIRAERLGYLAGLVGFPRCRPGWPSATRA